jgi:hypothetical protein
MVMGMVKVERQPHHVIITKPRMVISIEGMENPVKTNGFSVCLHTILSIAEESTDLRNLETRKIQMQKGMESVLKQPHVQYHVRDSNALVENGAV